VIVCEIFKSIQGESTFAGQICTFVRLTGCNLSCTWCDSIYARSEGTLKSIEDILAEVENLGTDLVEITGGEPLLQDETPRLCRLLIDNEYTVLVETNGSLDIGLLPEECVRIVDIKCPGSGHSGSFLMKNLEELTRHDECKFVIGNRGDFTWAMEFVKKYSMQTICPIHFSPVLSQLDPALLAQWIIDEKAPVRLSIQLHKILWGNKKGV
jgi:7-carboxy-7-deazaguanine synthase